jgi:hypothetical protein
MTSKYQYLAQFLEQSDQDMIRMTFEEVEGKIQGKLPPAALEHRAWWANSRTHAHARHGWLGAGYETSSVDMQARELVFMRMVHPAGISAGEAQHLLRPDMSAPVMRASSRRARRKGTVGLDDIVRAAGGVDSLMRIVEAIQQYIDGDLLETELGRILRKLWPRR